MSDSIAMSHQRGRKVNGQFVRNLPPGAATPPYVRVSRTIANSKTGRKVVSVGYIDGDYLAEHTWHFRSADCCQSAQDTSTSSSPNSLRNPVAGIVQPGNAVKDFSAAHAPRRVGQGRLCGRRPTNSCAPARPRGRAGIALLAGPTLRKPDFLEQQSFTALPTGANSRAFVGDSRCATPAVDLIEIVEMLREPELRPRHNIPHAVGGRRSPMPKGARAAAVRGCSSVLIQGSEGRAAAHQRPRETFTAKPPSAPRSSVAVAWSRMN